MTRPPPIDSSCTVSNSLQPLINSAATFKQCVPLVRPAKWKPSSVIVICFVVRIEISIVLALALGGICLLWRSRPASVENQYNYYDNRGRRDVANHFGGGEDSSPIR